MSVAYKNLMEDIALQNVERVMKASGGCCCDDSKSDVLAYALNHLPPHYVATRQGLLMVKLQSYALQFHADVVAALSEASELIAKTPRHRID